MIRKEGRMRKGLKEQKIHLMLNIMKVYLITLFI